MQDKFYWLSPLCWSVFPNGLLSFTFPPQNALLGSGVQRYRCVGGHSGLQVAPPQSYPFSSSGLSGPTFGTDPARLRDVESNTVRTTVSDLCITLVATAET